MVTEKIRQYVRDSYASGKNTDLIKRDLLFYGVHETDINQAVTEVQAEYRKLSSQARPLRKRFNGSIALIGLVVLFASFSTFLLIERLDLGNTNSQKVRDFYAQLFQSEISFTDTGEIIFPDDQKFLTTKQAYIDQGVSFVEADLRTMKLFLYEDGDLKETVDILSKGKEQSWWETPTGNYKVLGKAATAYSSIGHVWMPYSIQFYGNYFIHGWPHYDDGTPVPQGYSGGCIRLATNDARLVFDFVQRGTPILVLEERETYEFGTLTSNEKEIVPPVVTARSLLVTNFTTGEVFAEKNAKKLFHITSLAKLMTAVVAHEVIYLGRPIRATESMLANTLQIFSPNVGRDYIGLDLLYPLLMQSSDEAASLLAGFLGEEVFVHNMNIKASSLGMHDTVFADSSGEDTHNVSTVYDLTRLVQYIYYKRPFLFDISKGITVENVGSIRLGGSIPIENLHNANRLANNPQLVGVKEGGKNEEGENILTVWNINTAEGVVPIAIVVLGSADALQDTETVLRWIKLNFKTL